MKPVAVALCKLAATGFGRNITGFTGFTGLLEIFYFFFNIKLKGVIVPVCALKLFTAFVLKIRHTRWPEVPAVVLARLLLFFLAS